MTSFQKSNTPIYCRNSCGTRIKFDWATKSASGKSIPLDYQTGQKHQCPNSEYAKQQRGEVTTTPSNFGNAYSGNELGRETRSPQQYAGVIDDNDDVRQSDNTVILDLVQRQTVSLQHIENLLQDIKDAMLSYLNPNPVTTTAKELLTPGPPDTDSESDDNVGLAEQ